MNFSGSTDDNNYFSSDLGGTNSTYSPYNEEENTDDEEPQRKRRRYNVIRDSDDSNNSDDSDDSDDSIIQDAYQPITIVSTQSAAENERQSSVQRIDSNDNEYDGELDIVSERDLAEEEGQQILNLLTTEEQGQDNSNASSSEVPTLTDRHQTEYSNFHPHHDDESGDSDVISVGDVVEILDDDPEESSIFSGTNVPNANGSNATSSRTQLAAHKPAISRPCTEYKCPICLEPPETSVVTPCGHVFCAGCAFQMLNQSRARTRHGHCALCRNNVNLQSLRLMVLRKIPRKIQHT
ncbi:hypothetical protein TBLA_0D00440 [Henningerozyma blattae CBS 6284]|uniref:RING-type domain-containing protein n=1 Tax=Henningerozyma blattae (strain ATCC 34711 / CBS 6284 / DSM 70876 / NBRC 10599 / NRRL Y-10934 / UCD 77-7) TaxID=1071380 RepID=I2H2F2_HENB6|nr:hypothetical protein TBLA_0D00440 [Tetrapisispora blattae CBS 6284]CCH60554.1 hypothetical protein TBLA_0D00440 [Tetrapisispora blattae CBS 6284]